jgi:hypothetical protein
MTLWEEYLSYHPEFETRLIAIEKIARDKFIRKLKKEKDKENFLSIITEFQFYEFLVSKEFNINLEKEYFLENSKSKYTPDFTISKYGQSIIVEVLKLNTTAKDKIRSDFENYLFNQLDSIRKGCWLQIDFIEEYFDVELYSKEKIVEEVSVWLENNFYLNSEILLYDNFKFTITKVDNKLEHVCVQGNANSIDIDIRRLNSPNSRFVDKINKYSELIINSTLPYIICLKIDFTAAIGENEMFWTMYGDLLFYQHLNKFESTMNGFYYTNENAKGSLSGILLMINNKITYYNNYSFQNKLDFKIKKEFLEYQFFGETFSKLVYLRRVN